VSETPRQIVWRLEKQAISLRSRAERAEARVRELEEGLREIAECPNRGCEAESVDGQAWNDRAWVIARARRLLGEGETP
jgi:hypothetical protein